MSPAAARCLPIFLCAVFPRYARKNRTHLNIKYRSAEGSMRQLRKSYYNLQFVTELLLALQELIFARDELQEALGVAALGQAQPGLDVDGQLHA